MRAAFFALSFQTLFDCQRTGPVLGDDVMEAPYSGQNRLCGENYGFIPGLCPFACDRPRAKASARKSGGREDVALGIQGQAAERT